MFTLAAWECLVRITDWMVARTRIAKNKQRLDSTRDVSKCKTSALYCFWHGMEA